MSLFPHSKRAQRPSQGGFALVIALSLMAFVLLLLLSITTLVQVESQSSQSQMQRMEAEQSALLGLQIALGELQKAAGPDQRVTATAGIVNGATPVESTQHYTGVWNSDPSIPVADRFMQWLVSSSDNQLGQGVHTEAWSNTGQPVDSGSAYSVSAGSEDDFVLLVGNGSVDAASASSIQAVVAEKIAYLNSNGSQGKYAWWVADEGVKAKANVGTNENNLNFNSSALSDQLSTAYNLSASPRSGVEVLAPEYANFSKVLTDAAYRNDVSKVNSFAGIQILEAGTLSGNDVLKGNYHDLTLGSFGLLTNSVKGGLKEDLSLAFEFEAKDINVLVGDDQYLYNYVDTSTVRGPRWDILQEHYLNYKNLDTSSSIPRVKTRLGGEPGQYGELSASSSADRKNEDSAYNRFFSELHLAKDAVVKDATENVDGDGMTIPRAHSTPIAPVVLTNMMVLSTWVHDHDSNVMRGGGPNTVNLVVNPVTVLWNPYNCHMSLDPAAPEPYILNNADFQISIVAVQDRTYTPPWSQYIHTPYAQPVVSGVGHSWNHSSDKMAWLHDLSFDNSDSNTPDGIKEDGRKSALVIPRGLFEFAPGEMKLFSAGTDVKTGSYTGLTRELGDSEVNRNRVMDAQLGWNADGGWVINNMNREVVAGAWATESADDPNDIYKHNQPLYVHNWIFLEIWASDTMQTGLYYDSTDFEYPEYYSLKAQRTGADEVGYDEDIPFYRTGETSNSSSRKVSGDNNANGIVASGNTSWGTGPWSFSVFSEKTMSLDDRDEKEDGSSGAFSQAPELFLFNSPRARHISGINSSFLTNARQPYSGYKMERLAPASILPIDLDNTNTFWGESFSSSAGYGRLAMWEIPRLPLTSIAQLQHAQIERFQHEPSYAIGNSYASPFIDQDQLVSTRQLDYQRGSTSEYVDGSSVDSSYLCNQALWDDYFFSSITPEFALSSANYSESRTIEQVIAGFMDSSGGAAASLPNPRVKYVANSLKSDTEMAESLLDDTANASEKVAGSLMVDGTFNINSVSVEAWKAFLSGANNMPVLNNHLENGSSSVQQNNGGVVFSRFSIPNQSDYGTGIQNDDWEGYRLLDQVEINDLAVEIVRIIKERGPFYSVADFINRSLTTSGDNWKAGVLQLAIDLAGLNDGITGSGAPVAKTGGSASESFVTPTAGPEVNKAGMIGYLLQSDLLNQIGPFISNRSNTFKIRTYGESGNLTSGSQPAKAYLEAVIQQLPEYVDGTESPETVITDLNVTNESFGRKFRIVSITWLNEDEI
jgi:Tfp pilus assembly protein PilX